MYFVCFGARDFSFSTKARRKIIQNKDVEDGSTLNS